MASALLSYMLVSGVFGKRNIYAVDVSLEFPDEMFAGLTFSMLVKLLNRRKRSPAFLIRVIAGERRAFFPYVEPRSEAIARTPVLLPERGRVTIDNVYVSSVFPFNFFTRYRKLKTSADLIIYPRPIKCDLFQKGERQNRSRGDKQSDSPGFGSDLLSIRDYVSGDPTKYISWKSTAKTGRLMTRELSSIEMEQVTINFDRAEKEDLEHFISCVTWTVLKLMNSRVPVGITIGGETLAPSLSVGHRTRILTRLALYGKD